MSQYRICCYDGDRKIIWAGPERDIPSLPAGRNVLQDGEIYQLRGGNILAVTTVEGIGVWVDVVSANSSERIELSDKVVRIHNYSTLFTIQASNGGRIAFDSNGRKLGEFESIVAKKEEGTITGFTAKGKVVIARDGEVVL